MSHRFTVATCTVIAALFLTSAVFAQQANEAQENRYYHFQASKMDADIWAWGKAKASMANDVLMIREANPEGDAGSVHTADRLPYNKDGIVELEIAAVPSGYYTLQIMAFNKKTFLGEMELVKNSTEIGKQTIDLSKFKVPEGTDEIGFKIWVAGSKKAVTYLKELAYWEKTNDDDRESLLTAKLDKEQWGIDKVDQEVTKAGLKTTLAQGQNFGATHCKTQAKHDTASEIIIELGSTVQGKVKVQGIAFDQSGKMLGQVLVAEKLSVGRHKVKTDSLEWPENTSVVTFKFWLEGEKNASTVIRGLKVLK